MSREQLERKISKIEEEIGEMEQQMGEEGFYQSDNANEVIGLHKNKKKNLDDLMAQWEKAESKM